MLLDCKKFFKKIPLKLTFGGRSLTVLLEVKQVKICQLNKQVAYKLTHSCCGSGNTHVISIHQVSSHTAMLRCLFVCSLNYTPAAHAGTVVCPAAAAAAAATTLGNLLIKVNYYY